MSFPPLSSTACGAGLSAAPCRYHRATGQLTPPFRRIRELDTKAEHYERQIHRLEQERDDMEKKYEVRHSALLTNWIDCQLSDRKQSRSTRHPRPSSMRLFETWTLFNRCASSLARPYALDVSPLSLTQVYTLLQ